MHTADARSEFGRHAALHAQHTVGRVNDGGAASEAIEKPCSVISELVQVGLELLGHLHQRITATDLLIGLYNYIHAAEERFESVASPVFCWGFGAPRNGSYAVCNS